MSKKRTTRCPYGCGGIVAVPKGRRTTLEQILACHRLTCPAINNKEKA